MSTTTAVPEGHPLGSHTLIERVDSDRTDESPFGSTLTTPVDEDVILFSGIEQRLVVKPLISQDDASEDYIIDPKAGGIDEHALSKSMGQDNAKLMVATPTRSAPTPSPSLEQLPINVDMQVDSFEAPVSRPRAGPFAGEASASGSSELQACDAPKTLEENTSLEKTISSDKKLAAELDILNRQLENSGQVMKNILLQACNPPEPLEETKLSETTISLDKKLTVELDISSPQSVKTEQVTKDILSLLPFAHQAPSLDDLSRATDCFSSLQQLALRTLFPIALRVLIFLPWCVIAGASILLFPAQLETVVFGLGFVTSPRGIYRYVFWTEVSKELVGVFIAFLVIVWCSYPKVGLLVMAAVVAQSVYVWQGFRLNRNIPLGEDDKQSLYHVFVHYTSGHAMTLREDEDGFHLTT
ncbi:hypothetical protein DXG01_001536 [Tephrocybe rancida]|nr:hypothetical protein DXG01_001536 [Tephrocybe rancida]